MPSATFPTTAPPSVAAPARTPATPVLVAWPSLVETVLAVAAIVVILPWFAVFAVGPKRSGVRRRRIRAGLPIRRRRGQERGNARPAGHRRLAMGRMDARRPDPGKAEPHAVAYRRRCGACARDMGWRRVGGARAMAARARASVRIGSPRCELGRDARQLRDRDARRGRRASGTRPVAAQAAGPGAANAFVAHRLPGIRRRHRDRLAALAGLVDKRQSCGSPCSC